MFRGSSLARNDVSILGKPLRSMDRQPGKFVLGQTPQILASVDGATVGGCRLTRKVKYRATVPIRSGVVSRVTQPPSGLSEAFPGNSLDELAESRANTRAVIQVIAAVGEKTTPGTVMMSTLRCPKSRIRL